MFNIFDLYLIPLYQRNDQLDFGAVLLLIFDIKSNKVNIAVVK